jgi:hypothetical protein
MKQTADEIRRQGEESGGPPEGVPATGFLLLHDTESGTSLAISLFETEEDMQKGHETLNQMSPPGDGMGRRTAVEMYEVAVRFDQPASSA